MGRHSTTVVSPKSAKSPPLAVSKRKRDDLAQLKVDISAPEPPSKKFLRKAKRASASAEGKRSYTGEKSFQNEILEPAILKTNGEAETKTAKGQERSKRSEYGIWIGNLPWTATKVDIRSFLTDDGRIQEDSITRIYLPSPGKTFNQPQSRVKPCNKGFAYVDFSDQNSLDIAVTFTNTFLTERRVLIKNAKSFEGRPEIPAEQVTKEHRSIGKSPNTRVFVGNLGFDVTREELKRHFEQCGSVADLSIATFEDSGKCKGYGWITFGVLSAAEAAVRGWINIENEFGMDPDQEEQPQSQVTQPKRRAKPRKWWVNQLYGRSLRIEFAEDESLRYKKRFGGERNGSQGGRPKSQSEINHGIAEQRTKPHERHDTKRHPLRKIDARNVRPGAALAAAPRTSAAIVESQGQKVVFD